MEIWQFFVLAALVGLNAGWLLHRHVGVLVIAGLGAALAYWWYLEESDPCQMDCDEDLALLALIIFLLPVWAAGSTGAVIGAALRRLIAR